MENSVDLSQYYEAWTPLDSSEVEADFVKPFRLMHQWGDTVYSVRCYKTNMEAYPYFLVEQLAEERIAIFFNELSTLFDGLKTPLERLKLHLENTAILDVGYQYRI